MREWGFPSDWLVESNTIFDPSVHDNRQVLLSSFDQALIGFGFAQILVDGDIDGTLARRVLLALDRRRQHAISDTGKHPRWSEQSNGVLASLNRMYNAIERIARIA